jgi:lysophospholipase L1-like esterase
MQSMPTPFKQWLINIGIAVGVVVATDAGLAQIYNHFSDGCRPDLIDRSDEYRISSPIYHHDLAKNIRLDGAWGKICYTFRTNSLGFRDAIPRSVSPLPKSQRILFIGDSFIEGLGVAFEDTSVGIISNRLRSRKIEVLNAAVVSYSPAIYYRKVKYILEEAHIMFDYLVVFLDISDIEDEAEFYWIDDDDRVSSTQRVPERWHRTRRNDQHLKQQGNLPARLRIKNFLKDNSVLIRFGDLVKDTLEAKLITGKEPATEMELATGRARALWTVDDELFASYGAKGLRRASENMDRLLDIVRKHGIDLIVVVYPWPDQIINRDLNSRQVSFWQAWAKERKVQFIDLFPTFISVKDGEATIREYFIPGDVHWNESGNRLVAESFLKYYDQRAHQGN